MKKHRRSSTVNFNMDSFMDLLFNVLGALVFLVAYCMISGLDLRVLMRLPKEQSTEKLPIYLECRGENLFLLRKPMKLWLSEKIAPEDYYYLDSYEIEIDAENEIDTAIARPGAGEDSREISDPNSKFQGFITAVDPQTEYVAFFVRPDAFDIFREARRILQKNGIDVAWEPFPYGREIEFVYEGRGEGPPPPQNR